MCSSGNEQSSSGSGSSLGFVEFSAVCWKETSRLGFCCCLCFFFFLTFFSPYLVLVHGCNEKGEGDGSSCHGVGGRHPVLRIRPHLQLHDRWREGTRPLQDVLGDLPYVHHDLGRGNATGCQPAQGISTLPTPEPWLSELFCCKIHRPKSRAHPVNY